MDKDKIIRDLVQRRIKELRHEQTYTATKRKRDEIEYDLSQLYCILNDIGK